MFGRIARSEENLQQYDYEMRFDGNPSNRNKLVYGFRGGEGTADVPFSLWNIGIGTPEDTTDDYQIVAVGFDDSGNSAAYDGGAPPSDGGPGTMFDRVYFFEIDRNAGSAADIDNDGDVDYDDVLKDIADANGDNSAAIFGKPYLGPEVIARFSMVSLNNDPDFIPPVGTTIRITSSKALQASDVYDFSTSQFGLYANPAALDFGGVNVGRMLSLPLTFLNISGSTVSVSSINFDSPDYQISPATFSVDPGDSILAELTWHPSLEGKTTAAMTINSNDSFFPEYRFQIEGDGLPESTGLIRMLGRLPIPNIGTTDIWGYYDENTEREYALLGGQPNGGISIVDVTDPGKPELVSQVLNVPGFDVKSWSHYAYSVNGGSNGLGGIVDLSDPRNPQTVGTFPSSHNIFITDDGYMISEVSGIRIFDLNPDPLNPRLLWSRGGDGHDASVIGQYLYDFHGRDGTYIYDFSTPSRPNLISSIFDPGIQNNHSGWTSPDGNYLYICDELSNHPSPDVVVYDISDLQNPQRVGGFGDPNATIHNLFVVNNYIVTSYYTAGFKVFDISDPAAPVLADQFDTSPASGPGFDGTWGVYPFAPSGNIYVSDQETGLYIFSLNIAPTAIEPNTRNQPDDFALFDNYPNPFNPETTIEYQIPENSHVRLEIFNVLGQNIRTLVNSEIAPGRHTARWDGRDNLGNRVSSGVYLYQLRTEDSVATNRMLLLR